MNFSNKLWEIKKRLDLPDEAIADRVGSSRATVNAWLRKVNVPDLKVQRAVLEILNGKSVKPQAEDGALHELTMLASQEFSILKKNWKRMDSDEQDLVRVFVKHTFSQGFSKKFMSWLTAADCQHDD